MWQEFKQFAIKGNVIDLAVAVIIGGAFGKIVSSLVNDIIMPILGILLGGIDFSRLQFQYGEAVINYGLFLQSIVDFFIIAFTIFFVIRTMKGIKKQQSIPPVPAAPSQEIVLLTEIRDLLQKRDDK